MPRTTVATTPEATELARVRRRLRQALQARDDARRERDDAARQRDDAVLLLDALNGAST